jgi:hypothetical protein
VQHEGPPRRHLWTPQHAAPTAAAPALPTYAPAPAPSTQPPEVADTTGRWENTYASGSEGRTSPAAADSSAAEAAAAAAGGALALRQPALLSTSLDQCRARLKGLLHTLG